MLLQNIIAESTASQSAAMDICTLIWEGGGLMPFSEKQQEFFNNCSHRWNFKVGAT